MRLLGQYGEWPLFRANVPASIRGGKALALLVAAFSLTLLAGCSRGAYPLDFFPEMHYNQSYKIQEPPSLSAPADSVPITGRELDYTIDQARLLENPVPLTPATVERGTQLFQVNCAVCHGAFGKGNEGDGPMWQRLEEAGYRPASPGDLTATGPTVGKPDGEVFLIIAKGFSEAYGFPAGQFVMPPWDRLLTTDERWTLVHHLRSLQQ